MVVVLDPDASSAHELRESFEAAGLETVDFTDLVAAGDYLRQTKPDLLVIDPEVADVDGAKVVQFLGNKYAAGGVPMIVQSIEDDPRVIATVNRLHGAKFVHKVDGNAPQLLSIAREMLKASC
jgi:DNA-binding response OmpR family regulator